MASVDKIKVGTTTYDVSPSKNGTLTGYTSNDAASPTAWSSVNAITTSDTNSSIFSKVTTMIKNVRWLYNKLGTTDFSSIGDGTVSGALSSLNTSLSGKAASSHSHTVSDLPVSNTQTNSTSYIPTSALVYSMQQQITSLNDALSSSSNKVVVISYPNTDRIAVESTRSFITICSYTLGFDASKYAYCELTGECSVNYYYETWSSYSEYYCTLSKYELTYNIQSTSIDSDASNLNVFRFKYDQSIFYIYNKRSEDATTDDKIYPRDCSITANFHN